MLVSYITPLAPAAILLLSAFILPIIIPGLPRRRPPYAQIRAWSIPGLVGLALLTLLGIRLTPGEDVAGEGLELISGWNFSTTESVAALMVRADALSLAFLLVVLLSLLAITLLRSGDASTGSQTEQMEQIEHLQQATGWLVMGAGACLLFVSANGLTLIYGVMTFDIFVSLYWLGRGHRDWGVARLFLGVFTAAGIMLVTLAPATGFISGQFLLGLALWLRLGLYPFFETLSHASWDRNERLIYQALSLTVGIYLAVRMVGAPLPETIRWLAVIVMFLSGLLTWLAGMPAAAPNVGEAGASTGEINEEIATEEATAGRSSFLIWLILVEALFILIVEPLPTGIAMAFIVGLIFSWIALWVTPALGRPRFEEGAWSWPYLPAVAATITLVGVPLSLGWLAREELYGSLFRLGNVPLIMVALLAEALALSGLVRYWLALSQGSDTNSRRSTVGIVMMVPFLTPALAPFTLAAITGVDLSLSRVGASFQTILVMIALLIGGIYLGFSRNRLIARSKIPAELMTELARLGWLVHGWQLLLGWLARSTLRIRVILEGQHYMGWAVFIALIGALIILLS